MSHYAVIHRPQVQSTITRPKKPMTGWYVTHGMPPAEEQGQQDTPVILRKAESEDEDTLVGKFMKLSVDNTRQGATPSGSEPGPTSPNGAAGSRGACLLEFDSRCSPLLCLDAFFIFPMAALSAEVNQITQLMLCVPVLVQF
jgi:hypothetical protein